MIIVSILLPDIEVFLKVNEHKTRGSKKIFGTHENKKRKMLSDVKEEDKVGDAMIYLFFFFFFFCF